MRCSRVSSSSRRPWRWASASRATHSVAVRKATRWPARQARMPSAMARRLLCLSRADAEGPRAAAGGAAGRGPSASALDRHRSLLAIALGIRACLAGHRVAFRTATEWVALLADAQRQGRLDDELARLQRITLLIVDEVGYIPFDPQAANLMFMLVSRRYERASLIVTSNKPFSGWGEIVGDEVTAAAMIDRLVHHAEILALKGDSYRLKDRDLARPAPAEN